MKKINSSTLVLIEKTEEYLAYIKEHILNINKAFLEVKKACENLDEFNYMDLWNDLELDVSNHDKSKLSEHEFVQYRRAFYPTSFEEKIKLDDTAWNHHKVYNNHHWENIAYHYDIWSPAFKRKNILHMVIDWTAMAYKFGGSAEKYYNENKKEIGLPIDAVEILTKIFEALKKK